MCKKKNRSWDFLWCLASTVHLELYLPMEEKLRHHQRTMRCLTGESDFEEKGGSLAMKTVLALAQS